MKDEELIFDFMAAAKDTGKRVDALIEVIPGELRKTLANEYERSPWLATLPATADRLTAVVKTSEAAAARTESAAERTESTATQAVRKIKTVCAVTCIAAVIIPLATWGISCWQTRNLWQERDAIQGELSQLEAAVELAKGETGGGAKLYRNDEGHYVFSLPPGMVFNETAINKNRITYPPLDK